VREAIERDFGMVAMDANYGMSEIQSVIAGEGPARDGLISHVHGILLTELVDPEGRPVPVEPGAIGEFVFSTLRRQAQPLFRYRTNDLAQIIATETGEDGLPRMRFRVVGRSDQMLVIKGVNFFPQSLGSVVAEFPEELSNAFRVIRPAPGSVDDVDVVFETGIGPAGRIALAQAVERRASALLQVRIRAHWVPPGFLPNDGNKLRYLIDSVDDVAGLREHLAAPAGG
jgi:phenylacetate-CoA ligase